MDWSYPQRGNKRKISRLESWTSTLPTKPIPSGSKISSKTYLNLSVTLITSKTSSITFSPISKSMKASFSGSLLDIGIYLLDSMDKKFLGTIFMKQAIYELFLCFFFLSIEIFRRLIYLKFSILSINRNLLFFTKNPIHLKFFI